MQWWHDEISEPLTLDVLPTPSEHGFSLPVPAENIAGLIHRDVSIECGFEDRHEPCLGGSQLLLGPLALDGVSQHSRKQLAFDPPFDEVVLRAGADRFQRQPLIIESRDDHDRLVAGVLLHVPEGLESLTVRQPQVQEHHVDTVLLHVAQRSVQPVAPLELERGSVLLLAQHVHDQARVAWIVLDQEDSNRRGGGDARGHGSFTISSQNAPIAFTALRNTAGSIGFVT